MIREFRDFVNRGNFVEIAVAFVIGVAFGTVIETFTARIVTPLIGMLVQVSLAEFATFGPTDPDTGQPSGSVGAFIEALANFLIVAFVMFLVVKAYNSFKARTAAPEAEQDAVSESEELVLLREIRDALRGD